jgi:hypothetical protein
MAKLLDPYKIKKVEVPADVQKEVDGLRAQIDEMRRAEPDLPRGYFLHEPGSEPPPTHVLVRGMARK